MKPTHVTERTIWVTLLVFKMLLFDSFCPFMGGQLINPPGLGPFSPSVGKSVSRKSYHRGIICDDPVDDKGSLSHKYDNKCDFFSKNWNHILHIEFETKAVMKISYRNHILIIDEILGPNEIRGPCPRHLISLGRRPRRTNDLILDQGQRLRSDEMYTQHMH